MKIRNAVVNSGVYKLDQIVTAIQTLERTTVDVFDFRHELAKPKHSLAGILSYFFFIYNGDETVTVEKYDRMIDDISVHTINKSDLDLETYMQHETEVIDPIATLPQEEQVIGKALFKYKYIKPNALLRLSLKMKDMRSFIKKEVIDIKHQKKADMVRSLTNYLNENENKVFSVFVEDD